MNNYQIKGLCQPTEPFRAIHYVFTLLLLTVVHVLSAKMKSFTENINLIMKIITTVNKDTLMFNIQ